VLDIEPVAIQGREDKPDSHVAYRPTLTPLHEGVALQITPVANASGKFVALDIHSRITVRDSGAARRNAEGDHRAGPSQVVAALDRPRLLSQHLATTLRTPVDRVMLMGGMTFSSAQNADEPTMYLFMRTSVQELRDDIPESRGVEPAMGEPTPSEGGNEHPKS
jgi:hypothetical protein